MPQSQLRPEEVRPEVQDAVAAAAARLARAGVASPRVDAELLAAHVLGVDRGRLAIQRRFPAGGADRYGELVGARAARVPLQHLVGSAPFRYLELAVGPGVFIPRPETELLVDWALAVAPGGPTVVDLCSGTGAIALSVAHERPGSRVIAVEADAQALEWLRRNASGRVASSDPPVEVVAADATDPQTLVELDGTVDLLLCNPPYIPDGAPVAPEVSGYDPPGAVFAGPDGLAVIRPVIGRAVRLLRSGGWLGIEHHESHAGVVPELLRAAGFGQVSVHADLAGRPRYCTGQHLAHLPP
ncbi:MAG: peptide chain release factor N(5)-glutamine methyltransferase [Micromonosporaceae bacterium]|nr:peptide chain release factor N(5)-glutamine methyltransferase [Micromonosporaceae bacterium]